ncbi:MAG: hypothetical protein J5706_03795 [Elusimicrobiales bacterium]|nr:hypothetical protein [Elusimicrobiales bacterium]
MAKTTCKELETRINHIDTRLDKLFVLLEEQNKVIKNLATAKQAVKPAAEKSSTKKSGTKKSNKKAKAEVTDPGVHFEKVAAKNGNGEVIWLKFDKPCNNEQYCLLTCRNKKTFAKLEGKKSLWTWSKTMKAYHAIYSEKAQKQVDWFLKNYIPATEEELAVRKAAFNKAK